MEKHAKSAINVQEISAIVSLSLSSHEATPLQLFHLLLSFVSILKKLQYIISSQSEIYAVFPNLFIAMYLSKNFNITVFNVKANLAALDLILSLLFYCGGCPRYWGRQQVARMSNTHSRYLSVQWIDVAEATGTHSHVNLNTLRTGLFRSPSSSGARNGHTCDRVCA